MIVGIRCLCLPSRSGNVDWTGLKDSSKTVGKTVTKSLDPLEEGLIYKGKWKISKPSKHLWSSSWKKVRFFFLNHLLSITFSSCRWMFRAGDLGSIWNVCSTCFFVGLLACLRHINIFSAFHCWQSSKNTDPVSQTYHIWTSPEYTARLKKSSV